MSRPITAALALLLALGVTARGAERSSCETCHSEEAAEHKDSDHAAAGLDCVTCHGGDPQDFTERAMAAAKGFTGAPSRTQQPAWCANCHSKSVLMRPYGLPTDQWAEYQTSQHGRALAKGETAVAVCTDCHTTHAIRAAKDPRSSVSPVKLAETCGRCHADEKLMGRFGVSTAPVRDYLSSEHNAALQSDHTSTAPTCADCHGSHGAVPPKVAEIEVVCGRCHKLAAQQMEASPHADAVRDGRMKPCVGCHSDHAIVDAGPDMLLTSCGTCHADEPEVKALADRLHADLADAWRTYDEVKRVIEGETGESLPYQKIEIFLDESHTALVQAAALQHSLQPRDVERQTAEVQRVADNLEELQSDRRDQVHFRMGVLLYVWGYLAASIAALFIMRQRYEARRKAAGDA